MRVRIHGFHTSRAIFYHCRTRHSRDQPDAGLIRSGTVWSLEQRGSQSEIHEGQRWKNVKILIFS